MDTDTRLMMESRFGHDFSRVRVHTDTKAAASAQAINARAYTVGQDVVFGSGRYAPGTPEGSDLIEHELGHTAESARQGSQDSQRLYRAPDTPQDPAASSSPQATPVSPVKPSSPTEQAQEPALPPDKLTWKWKDLAVYPLLVDVWKDVILKQLTEKERTELRLKGYEAAAFYGWAAALGLPFGGLGGAKFEGDFGKDIKTFLDYTEAIEPLTPSKSIIMDGLSRIAGIRIDDYLSSDLFKLRLKTHVASVVSLFLIAQGIYSTVQAVKEPSAAPGELEPAQWTKQIGLVTGLTGLIFKEQLKAPDFFDVGPLQLKTHPAFAASPFAGGGAPSGLTLEQSEGVGEAGKETKFSLTLNAPKLILPYLQEGISAEDIGKLEKYRGWQTSLWFTYDKLDPTKTMEEAGKLPEARLKGGAIFGSKGHLGLLEGGARYSGEEASELSSWFLKGGYGYSGPKGSYLNRIGFTAVYTDWKETDILAPGRETGSPTAGRAFQFTPFTKLEFGSRHKFGVGAALSFVTGSEESFGVSSFRGDLSYTYMGDRSPESLPVFKIDLSGSLNRLDWWNPNSPLLWGVQAKGTYKDIFGGVQVATGAGDIPESRAGLIDNPEKVQVPTSVLFVGGYNF